METAIDISKELRSTPCKRISRKFWGLDLEDKSVVLSIDLDFFNTKDRWVYRSFLRKVLGLKQPIYLMSEHDEQVACLPDDFDVLVNMDEHSDISEVIERDIDGEKKYFKVSLVEKKLVYHHEAELHCGNWVNFCYAPHRTYVWVAPKASVYTCIGRDSSGKRVKLYNELFDKDGSKLRNWKEVLVRGQIPKDFKIYSSIGVSVSDEYTDKDLVQIFFEEFYDSFKKKKNCVVSDRLKRQHFNWARGEK